LNAFELVHVGQGSLKYSEFQTNLINLLAFIKLSEVIIIQIAPKKQRRNKSTLKGKTCMSRLNMMDPTFATGELKDLFADVNSTFGMVPNFVKALGNSPALLKGFLGLYSGLAAGAIDPATAERIALAMAESNSCDYCLAAHTALAQGAGLSGDEIVAARQGTSQQAKAAAAVRFARAVLDNKGQVTSAEIDAVRQAGHGDAEIAEIIGHVGLNTLLNYFGKAASLDIDFERAPALPGPRL
jgi:uncharacterized peroxidase-related enzyme